MRHSAWLFIVVLSACGSSAAPKPDPVLADTTVEEEDVVPEAFEIATEPVSLTSGDLTLSGTFVHPRGLAPRPGAVIVADWGIRGRDGVVGEAFGVRLPAEVAVYRGIAEGLAARGVAVLIYDKRNCVKDTEAWCTYPPEYATANPAIGSALVADAQVAIRWLAAREDVSSVSVIGHGHGGEVAVLAALDEDVKRVALLQPSSSALPERAKFQVEESIRQIEARIATVGDTPEADLLKTKKKELEEALKSSNLLGLVPEAAADLDVLHTTFLGALSEAKVPRLALLGEVDPGEPAGDAGRLRELFGEDLVVIGELSRLMVSLAADEDPTVISPAVLTHLSAFLNADLPK